MESQLFQMLVHENEISWKSLIYDLIRQQNMDPWDINVTILSQRYLARIKELKQADLKISGKVLLAAAILLKIKSKKLLGDDILEFDRLLAAQDDDEDFYDDLEQQYYEKPERVKEDFPIYPRTPQLRKRKVSVFDLLGALEKAMEVKHRRQNRIQNVSISAPEKKLDISIVLKNLFQRILNFFKKNDNLTYSKLLQTNDREERVRTFMSILYLSNEKKISLKQKEPYGEIDITLGKAAPV
ncbi:segregation/condensation protein A [Nanoarchaeota archaeon]